MSQTPKVSVIVPVYNVEKTLERCINSIINQTYKDFEVILVDDGSTDRSGVMCDELAKKYGCISVIHKSNEGLGPTRNCGVKAAKGEYIYHCDSDDWLSQNLLKTCVETIERTGAEVLIFGYTIYTEDNEGRINIYDQISLPACTLDSQEAIRQFYTEQYYNSFSVQSACNRLYRREFLIKNKLEFPPLRRCQDMAFSLLLFSKLKKVTCLKEAYYNYIIEPGVFKGRSFDEMIATYLDIYERTKATFSEWELYDETQRIRLQDKICEHIANYTAYAVIKKYPSQWKSNLALLSNNKSITELFINYGKKSRFIKLFSWGLIHNRLRFIKIISKLAQSR